MFGNNKKTIGVFISQVNDEYQDTLSKGIIKRAQELGYNVAFFTNFGGFGQFFYDLGEAYIAALPNYEELDGIIITPDIMMLPNLKEQYISNIKSRSHCPVVSVRREIKDFYNVLIDDNTVLDELITHFIEKHGFTRINFLSGPEGFQDTDRRLSNYKKILTKYNIPVEEERIGYGNLERNADIDAVDYWLNSPLERPQAIVCANDYLALTICRALAARGIAVPDEIAVTGCYDIEDAAEYSPSITTARMPVYEMGMEAVDKIHKHNMGEEQPKYSYMKTITMYRASCGCKKNWYHESNVRRVNHIQERETLQNEITRNAYMSTDLTGITNLDEIVNKLRFYIYENVKFSHFCMCLQENWDVYTSKGEDEKTRIDDDFMMEIGIKNKVTYTKLKCSRNELIPVELSEDKPMTYYFAVLHHQQHFFGYIGISFKVIQTYMKTFQAWLINVSNALENVRIHGEMNRLVYRLEDMSIRDEMTSLYNRRVLESLGKTYLNRCMAEQMKLMILTADMDGLKYINDRFGHACGDIALKEVANALLKAADDDEICIRLGGDEFMALGMDYDEAKMCKFINRFVQELNRFNTSTEYDFEVYVSYGYNLILPNAETTIESCLSLADSLMYHQKYDKASKSIKANIIC